MKTELCDIMNSEGSDKGGTASGHHNYTEFYYDIFNDIKNNKLHVFEVGLGTNNLDVPSNMGPNGIPGASLRGWKQFFPNSKIYGADVDRRILFSEDRIETFYVDQTNENDIAELWRNDSIDSVLFDIIVDDGLHTVDANVTFLKNSIHKLKDNGTYIIEDVMFDNIPDMEAKLNEIDGINFEIKILENPANRIDNCLVIIKWTTTK